MRYLISLLLCSALYAGWVSPTGDENIEFSNPTNMYDGNTATVSTASNWGQNTTLTIASTSCSKVRVYAGRAADAGQADLKIEVYYASGFHTIYDNLLAEDTWVEIDVGSTQDITKAKITLMLNAAQEVGEFEFWDASGAAAPDSTKFGGTGSDTLKLGGTGSDTIKIGY